MYTTLVELGKEGIFIAQKSAERKGGRRREVTVAGESCSSHTIRLYIAAHPVSRSNTSSKLSCDSDSHRNTRRTLSSNISF
jgi:hypothetical protein